jgi:hypothetical protein
MPRRFRREGSEPSRGLSAALHGADVADSPGEEVHRVPDRAEHPPFGARLPEACWTGTEAAGATRLGSPGLIVAPGCGWAGGQRSSWSAVHACVVSTVNASDTTGTSESCAGVTVSGVTAQSAGAAGGNQTPVPATTMTWAATRMVTLVAMPGSKPRPRVDTQGRAAP